MAFDWNQFQPFEGGGIVDPNSGRTIDQPMLQQAPPVPGYDFQPYDPNSPRRGYGGEPGPNNPEYAGRYNPDGSPIAKSGFVQPSPGGITFDPSKMAPSSPAIPSQGGGMQQMGGNGDPEAFRAAWYASPYPKNVEGLKQFVAANPQFGAQITGSKGSKIIIGGQAFQAVRSAGLGGGIGPAWDPLGPEGGGGTGSAPGYGSLNGLGAGYMTSPLGEFTPPSYEDALKDPAAQYAIGEAVRRNENLAAARGTLLNGRRIQALDQDILANANTLYGDIYNRAANTFGINYGVKTGNQDRPFSKYLSLAQLGQGAASQS